jgi:hypothetical protein
MTEDEALAIVKPHCVSHGGMAGPGMEFVLKHFYLAHKAAPGGLSIEVGSYAGDTARSMLTILAEIYQDPPTLFTVDPYGRRRYHSGDCEGELLFGNDLFIHQKKMLAGYTNHAHFLLTSFHFIEGVLDKSYWHSGVEKKITNFTYVLLDGEHNLETVEVELTEFKSRMAPGGRIVIDNVDKDPLLIPELLKMGCKLGPADVGFGARQAVYIQT